MGCPLSQTGPMRWERNSVQGRREGIGHHPPGECCLPMPQCSALVTPQTNPLHPHWHHTSLRHIGTGVVQLGHAVHWLPLTISSITTRCLAVPADICSREAAMAPHEGRRAIAGPCCSHPHTASHHCRAACPAMSLSSPVQHAHRPQGQRCMLLPNAIGRRGRRGKEEAGGGALPGNAPAKPPKGHRKAHGPGAALIPLKGGGWWGAVWNCGIEG